MHAHAHLLIAKRAGTLDLLCLKCNWDSNVTDLNCSNGKSVESPVLLGGRDFVGQSERAKGIMKQSSRPITKPYC